MSYKKIPKSVKEIVEVFIQYRFSSLTYKQISKALGLDINTVIQRIKRNEESYFEITTKRPYQISLIKNVKEIYFQRDKNQCLICRRKFNPDELILRFKNPNLKHKYNWENGFTCCIECKNKSIGKKPKSKTQRKKPQIGKIWEYKEIIIKKVVQNPYKSIFEGELPQANLPNWGPIDIVPDVYLSSKEGEDYYEFDELKEKGWFHLVDDDDKISSLSIIKILNYFGDNGWELVSFIELKPNLPSFAQFQALNQEEYYRCIFKRKKE